MKYKFWVRSSRMTNIEEIVEINDSWEPYGDKQIEIFLENWCEDVFPMFRFTDAFVSYGFKRIENRYFYSDNVE